MCLAEWKVECPQQREPFGVGTRGCRGDVLRQGRLACDVRYHLEQRAGRQDAYALRERGLRRVALWQDKGASGRAR